MAWIVRLIDYYAVLRWFETDVAGLYIETIFKDQAWAIRSPGSSVSNQLTPRNDPEDGRIQLNRNEKWTLNSYIGGVAAATKILVWFMSTRE
jgi:hypothetical protein